MLSFGARCGALQASTTLSYTTASISAILCLITVPGNLLICLAVYLDPYKRLRTPFNIVVANLAFADLIVGLITEPFSVHVHVREVLGRDITLLELRALHLSYFIACTASVLSISLLALERYVSITYSFKYRLYFKARRFVIVSMVVWLVSIGLSMIYILTSYIFYTFVFINIAVLWTVGVTTFCYVKILRRLKKDEKSYVTNKPIVSINAENVVGKSSPVNAIGRVNAAVSSCENETEIPNLVDQKENSIEEFPPSSKTNAPSCGCAMENEIGKENFGNTVDESCSEPKEHSMASKGSSLTCHCARNNENMIGKEKSVKVTENAKDELCSSTKEHSMEYEENVTKCSSAIHHENGVEKRDSLIGKVNVSHEVCCARTACMEPIWKNDVTMDDNQPNNENTMGQATQQLGEENRRNTELKTSPSDVATISAKYNEYVSNKYNIVVTKTYILVSLMFLASYIPALLIIYTLNWCSTCSCSAIHAMRDTQFIIVIFNSSINPFLYAIRFAHFRKAIVKILQLMRDEVFY